LIKFVACQCKRHSIKCRAIRSIGDKAKKVSLKARTHKHTHTHTRGAQVPTEINESMNGTAGEMEDTERETMHWHSNQVKRKNVDFTLTRT